MPLLYRMAVEIDVRIEILAVAVFVRAAAEVPRVVEKVGNSGEPPDQIEQRRRLHQIVERGVGRTESAHFFDRRLVADLAVFVARVAALERREFGEKLRRIVRREEVVDDDVAERLATRETLRVCGCVGAHVRGNLRDRVRFGHLSYPPAASALVRTRARRRVPRVSQTEIARSIRA